MLETVLSHCKGFHAGVQTLLISKLRRFVIVKALMSGFNDKKAIDELYESRKYEQDETDNQLAQGPEEVCINCY